MNTRQQNVQSTLVGVSQFLHENTVQLNGIMSPATKGG